MSELFTASVIDVSTFRFPEAPLPATHSRFNLWKVEDVANGEIYAVKTYHVTRQDGADVPHPQQLKNISYFFRDITGLLIAAHPTVAPLVGWNVQLGEDPKLPRFLIATKYLQNDPIRFTADRGFALRATHRQIILYGVACGLEFLHSRRQLHQDLKPENILLDKHFYPRLANVGLPSYTITQDSVIATCKRYIAPEVLRGRTQPGMRFDQFSYAMLLYEFLEDREAVPPTNPDETPEQAIIRGARPVISSLGEQFRPLLESLWNEDPAKRKRMTDVREYFEDPNHWLPGVNAQLFWKYKAHLETALEKQKDSRISTATARKPYGDDPAAAVGSEQDLPTILGIMIGVMNDKGTEVDPPTRDLVKESLTRKGTLDPKILAPLHPRPIPPSFFTSAVAQIAEFNLGDPIGEGSYGRVFTGTKPPDPTKYAIRRQTPFDPSSDQFPKTILSFFREILTQIYSAHPAVLPLVAWNAYPGRDPVELWLVTKFAENGSLTLGKIKAMTPTQKQIVAYGVARGMAYLHSLKIMHRDLKPENVFLDERMRPYVAGLGFAKYSNDFLQSQAQLGTDLYMAPEVFESNRYGLPADVYSYAIMYYELVEGRQGKVQRRASMADYGTLVGAEGRRPTIDSASEFQGRLLEMMWAGAPDRRIDFHEISTFLEDEQSWFDGVDRDEFLKYKGFLDSNEPSSGESQLILPEWVTKASQSEALKARIQGVEGNIPELFIRILAFLTTRKADQEVAFMTSLRQSFTSAGCIDPGQLLGYVRQHLAVQLAKAKKKTMRSPKALTPLTGQILLLEDLDIEPTIMGKGSFGVVYKGKTKNRAVEQTVAVKRINLPARPDSHICSNFREIVTLIYCKHPTVIPFVGWNFVSDRGKSDVVIVTEWMDNGSLDLTKRWDPTTKSILAYGGARGLAVLHERKVIHRDVKPDNIFVDKNMYPRIADFGMAKMIVEEAAGHTQTMGSPYYMAPEVWGASPEDQDGAWSFPADVYAYAILLWGLYAGKQWTPSNIKTSRELRRKIVSGALRPDRIKDKMNDDIWNLLQRMWHQSPDARPRISEVADLLEQPRYWVPQTSPDVFHQYVSFLEREASQEQVESIDEWGHLLENTRSARQMADQLADGPLKGSVMGKIAHALGIISASEAVPNQKVIDAVKTCLDEKGYLDPKDVNAEALAMNDPQAPPEEEPEQAELPPIEPDDRPVYHFQWIKDDLTFRFQLHLGNDATVQDLFKALGEILKGQFELYLGSDLLDPYSRDRIADRHLGEYLLKIVVRN